MNIIHTSIKSGYSANTKFVIFASFTTRRVRAAWHSNQRCLSFSSISKKSFSTKNGTSSIGKIINVKDVRKWSEQNSSVAGDVLRVPQFPPLHQSPLTTNPEEDKIQCLEDYLKQRNWNQTNKAKTDGDTDEQFTNAILSHTLTFPLTLATNSRHFLSSKLQSKTPSTNTSYAEENDRIIKIQDQEKKSNTDNNNHTSDNPDQHVIQLRLCCVGARAEATLPDEFWKEFLIGANLFEEQHQNYYNRPQEKKDGTTLRIHWIIDFLGPDIPTSSTSKSGKTVSLADDKGDSSSINSVCNITSNAKIIRTHPICRHSTITRNYYKTYLHQYILEQYRKQQDEHMVSTSTKQQKRKELLNAWDGFVLFNPGIGHPNLQKLWSPTIKFILKTGKKILMTAHSELDAQRDLTALSDLVSSSSVLKGRGDTTMLSTAIYNENPFASRIQYEDPFTSISNQKEVSKDHQDKANFESENDLKLREKRGDKMHSQEMHLVRPNHLTLLL